MLLVDQEVKTLPAQAQGPEFNPHSPQKSRGGVWHLKAQHFFGEMRIRDRITTQKVTDTLAYGPMGRDPASTRPKERINSESCPLTSTCVLWCAHLCHNKENII